MTKPQELANAVRALSMDAVEHAKSGHPGAPMGMADIAEVLWNNYLKHNPLNPKWYDRDRFVLSNGHGSMLLYTLLHLSGYDVTIEDIKNFRQLHSKTPGHPEYDYTPGVETTTGPLGQGIANAVGMAISEKTLASQFNRTDHTIVDHYTYVFLGDGCMMEGISHEACSLAGTLGLGKLIAFYDDNGISIDGKVTGWFTDDTVKRFESYGWHVISDVDGHNTSDIDSAIQDARSETEKPTLICCKTVIGYGSPNKAGSESSHGSPLGKEEIEKTREQLGWQYPPFFIPKTIYDQWNAQEKGHAFESDWNQRFEVYRADYPELASEFERRMQRQVIENFPEKSAAYIKKCQEKCSDIASRKASQKALNQYGPLLPELFGGSADLAGSNLTLWKDAKGINEEKSGNYIYYGVREFAMTAIMNGIALHGGFIPYGATFLVFSDYARNAIRLSALMKQQVIHVYTHDSIGLGEDGPTHQPVEHLASLRIIPGLHTWRPCDDTETAVAWRFAILHHQGPSVLVFSRQTLQSMQRDDATMNSIDQGGYILLNCEHKTPALVIIATGSEVQLAVQAYKALTEKGFQIRVVSMPCTTVFDAQPLSYKEQVLGSNTTKRLAIEAGHTDFWYKYVGLNGKVIGMQTFGESAPANDLFNYFGFTTNHVIEISEEMLNQS